MQALIGIATLGTVGGAIVASQLYWRDLRSGIERMDQSLDTARERQRQLALHLAEAQDLLVAEQRHLLGLEEGLKVRESALAAERIALDEEWGRLRHLDRSPRDAAHLTAPRELAMRLDQDLERIAEAGAADRVERTLNDLETWPIFNSLAQPAAYFQ